jgi:hypothetical protein
MVPGKSAEGVPQAFPQKSKLAPLEATAGSVRPIYSTSHPIQPCSRLPRHLVLEKTSAVPVLLLVVSLSIGVGIEVHRGVAHGSSI